MIVVPVLMTSCQVSLNPNTGPVTAHTRTMVTATPNATGRPVQRAPCLAKRPNQLSLSAMESSVPGTGSLISLPTRFDLTLCLILVPKFFHLTLSFFLGLTVLGLNQSSQAIPIPAHDIELIVGELAPAFFDLA